MTNHCVEDAFHYWIASVYRILMAMRPETADAAVVVVAVEADVGSDAPVAWPAAADA